MCIGRTLRRKTEVQEPDIFLIGGNQEASRVKALVDNVPTV